MNDIDNMDYICEKLNNQTVISFQKVCDYWQIVLDCCVISIYSEIMLDVSDKFIEPSYCEGYLENFIGDFIVGIQDCDDTINIIFNNQKRIVIMPVDNYDYIPERICVHFKDNTIIVVE